MSIMATKDRTHQTLVSVLTVSNSQPSILVNQDLILVLSARNVQPSSTALVVRPPAHVAAVTAGNEHPQANIANAAQSYPANNVKLQSIIKR